MDTTFGWVPPIADFDWAASARSVPDQAIEEALGDTGTGVVHRHVVEGHAPRVLLRAPDDAALVVVISRGHGEFAGMLLGSVAQHVLARAPCPVVVVRTPAAAGTDPTPHL